MIKRGVYCAKNESNGIEIHAGAKIPYTYYHHICFYYPDKMVGAYFGGKNWYKPFIDKTQDYKGEITYLDDKKIEFYVLDPYLHDRIIYSGSHTNDQLEMNAIRESKPGVIWWKDTFEYQNGT